MHVIIVVNSGKPDAVARSGELARWLAGGGHEADIVDSEEIIVDGGFNPAVHALLDDVKLYITLGGDGTILSAAQLVFKHYAPILGFNFGHLGFLAGATSGKLFEAVDAALRRELDEQYRSALEVKLEWPDGEVRTYKAFNEVAITRGITGKMIQYDVTIEGDLLTSMRADGVIVASPTGSTAYSLSAGGPIVSPSLSCMVVVALAPHSLISRALVTGEDETVCIIPDTSRDKDCSVFIDGVLQKKNLTPTKITVRVVKDVVKLLRYDVPRFAVSASKAFFRSPE